MPEHASGYATRDEAEVRDRIADILGYCNLDGRLHDPENFDKKLLRRKWVCPDCSTVAGKVAYKRAKELRWMLIPPESSRAGDGGSLGREDASGSQDDEDETETSPDEDDEDDTTAGTDSEDVKARIESAQEDIEELEETAEQ